MFRVYELACIGFGPDTYWSCQSRSEQVGIFFKIKNLLDSNRDNYGSYLTDEERRDLQGLIRLNRVIDPIRNCWFTSNKFIGNPPIRDKYIYQSIKFRGKSIPIHRLSAIAFLNLNSENPKWVVCHKCDTPACFNPDHLFIGTDSDNQKDSVNKGRTTRPKFIKPETKKQVDSKVQLELKNISDKIDRERKISAVKAAEIGKRISDGYLMTIEECNKILGK